MMRRFRSLFRNEAGAAAAELALTLPLIGTLLFAIIKFGIVYNNYLALTSATANTARQFSLSSATNPISSAENIFINSAPSMLNNKSLTLSFSVSGTSACTQSLTGPFVAATATTTSDCSTMLSNGAASGGSVTVTASYSNCDIKAVLFVASACTLTATASDPIQ